MPTSPVPNLDAFTDYEYEVTPGSASAGAYVLGMVPHAARVLELGAGSGSITRHLVEQLACTVTAIENNPASARKLWRWCQNVHAADLNDPGWPKALAREPPFDVVLAADVLEHLYDPWKVLGQMKGLLKPEGSIILSLPHAAHCAVLASLLAEDFAYGEWGLLDKTHIRFFGINNIQAMHDHEGLVIEEARFVLRAPEKIELANVWARLPLPLQSALRLSPYADVYQVVTRAQLAGVGDGVRLIDVPVE